MPKTTAFISITPNLTKESGHDYSYHQSVEKGVRSLGWQNFVLLPKDCSIKNLPDNWIKCLVAREKSWNAGGIRKIFHSFLLAKSLAGFFRNFQREFEGKRCIFFMESFSFFHLFGLTLALPFLPKKNSSLLLLYRYDSKQLGKMLFFHKLALRIIDSLLPPNRLQLLTDSEPLKDDLSQAFGRSFLVMPIPHTDQILEQSPATQASDKIICWWPGPPRAAKGLDIIRLFLKCQSKDAARFQLLVSRKADFAPVENGVDLKVIDDPLPRSEYERWMSLCDLILLPYDASVYRYATSGVFTEAISAGKIPVVTAGTWMAHELKRHHLSELIFDWENPDLPATLLSILSNQRINEKIQDLKSIYLNFHSIDNYAAQLKSICNLENAVADEIHPICQR
jgi:hypothetical protein